LARHHAGQQPWSHISSFLVIFPDCVEDLPSFAFDCAHEITDPQHSSRSTTSPIMKNGRYRCYTFQSGQRSCIAIQERSACLCAGSASFRLVLLGNRHSQCRLTSTRSDEPTLHVTIVNVLAAWKPPSARKQRTWYHRAYTLQVQDMESVCTDLRSSLVVLHQPLFYLESDKSLWVSYSSTMLESCCSKRYLPPSYLSSLRLIPDHLASVSE
jgi:hypothetical protein